MRLALCMSAVLLVMCSAAIAYDCSAWPEGCPGAGGQGPVPPLGEGNTFTCTANYVSPIQSSVTPQQHQLVYTQDEWNKTAEVVNWSISTTVKTTHSWSVGATVRADLKAGILARIIADAKISVEVNGEYSGSKEKSRTVEVSTTVPGCRGKGRREYVDKYTANVTQTTADYYWVRSDGYWVLLNPVDHTGSGAGDDSLTGEFVDLGQYTQSTDECKNCYQAP